MRSERRSTGASPLRRRDDVRVVQSTTMLTRRAEALRRLGGPVCPVCDTVGAKGIDVRLLSGNGAEWLRARGKGDVEHLVFASMCEACFLTMENSNVARRAQAAAQRAREGALAVADAARLGSLSGPRYREACAEHEDDLTAAEAMAAEWGVGNGLFGSRGE